MGYAVFNHYSDMNVNVQQSGHHKPNSYAETYMQDVRLNHYHDQRAFACKIGDLFQNSFMKIARRMNLLKKLIIYMN